MTESVAFQAFMSIYTFSFYIFGDGTILELIKCLTNTIPSFIIQLNGIPMIWNWSEIQFSYNLWVIIFRYIEIDGLITVIINFEFILKSRSYSVHSTLMAILQLNSNYGHWYGMKLMKMKVISSKSSKQMNPARCLWTNVQLSLHSNNRKQNKLSIF